MRVSELAHGVSCLVFEALCRWSLVCLPAMCYSSQPPVFSASFEKSRLFPWRTRSPSRLFMLHPSTHSCSCLSHTLWLPRSLTWKVWASTPWYNSPWAPQPEGYLGSASPATPPCAPFGPLFKYLWMHLISPLMDADSYFCFQIWNPQKVEDASSYFHGQAHHPRHVQTSVTCCLRTSKDGWQSVVYHSSFSLSLS